MNEFVTPQQLWGYNNRTQHACLSGYKYTNSDGNIFNFVCHDLSGIVVYYQSIYWLKRLTGIGITIITYDSLITVSGLKWESLYK